MTRYDLIIYDRRDEENIDPSSALGTFLVLDHCFVAFDRCLANSRGKYIDRAEIRDACGALITHWTRQTGDWFAEPEDL